MNWMIAALALALAACGGKDRPRPTPPPVAPPTDAMRASAWELGPPGYAKNVPGSPTQDADGSWYFDLGPGKEVDYVTYVHGPLLGKTQIRMRFRVEPLEEGAYLFGALEGRCPYGNQTGVTPYFATIDNDWGNDGTRWWASFTMQLVRGAGEYEVVAPLNSSWSSLSAIAPNPKFTTALARTSRVGFTFANCIGYGHGATADGAVRFRVLEFAVE
jgi:hypothetical protein